MFCLEYDLETIPTIQDIETFNSDKYVNPGLGI